MPRARNVTNGVTLTGTTETVIATLPAIVTGGSTVVDIDCNIAFSPGSDATTVTFRIRADSLTGIALVGVTEVTVAGQAFFNAGVLGSDTPGDTAGKVYVLTARQGGGVANGITNASAMLAIY